jgi:hypothetical protein
MQRYRCTVLMGGDQEVFKRYGKNEEQVRDELFDFLTSAYGHVCQIREVSPDKTKTI